MSAGLGLTVIGAALAALFGIGYVLRTRHIMNGETSRKMLHVGMGLACLPLPLFVTDARWVVGAAIAAGVVFAAVRLVPLLRQRFGCVLHDVGRASYGEFAFIAGIAAAFVLADGDLVVYALPVLVLTFADSVAALIGCRKGTHRIPLFQTVKTFEGSLAFFAATCVVVALPLLLLGSSHALEAGVIAAVVLTIIELGSTHGFDNLTIPLAGAVLFQELNGAAAAGALGW